MILKGCPHPQNNTTISRRNRKVAQDQTLLPTRGALIWPYKYSAQHSVLKNHCEHAMGILTIIPALKAETSERTAWATQEVKGQPELHSRIIFQWKFLELEKWVGYSRDRDLIPSTHIGSSQPSTTKFGPRGSTRSFTFWEHCTHLVPRHACMQVMLIEYYRKSLNKF